jgi:DNA-binding CsgD family transcriptional regulator
MNNEIKHYGMPRRSGRYPWGSGESPHQRNNISFRGHVQELRKQGLSDVEIAKGEGITTTQLRARMSLGKAEQRAADTAEAARLKDKGYSNVEIGKRMGINESSVRSLLNPVLAERASVTMATANMLKDSVDQKRFIDVGAGVENHVGVSRTKLNTAIAQLEEQGYKIHRVNVEQIGMPGQFTIVKVLGAPDTEWKEVVRDLSKIQSITAYSDDFGRTFHTDLGLKPIKNVDSKRIEVKYAEDGGSSKDGVIELRRGVKDLDLGNSKYAQVRIGVDGTHYLKGMAIYSDDMPDGVDIIFNTNKRNTGNKLDALKGLKDEPDNPFGSTIKRQKGAINIVNEEGDWAKWSKTISSQILSKQTVPLAKAQLELALRQKKEEFEEIMSLTNPVVKRQLLTSFADDCDASSVHLKAAALPRQASKVILPVPSMKENEVYAPTFKNGEKVVLIRHPHGGTFEIPQLTVNNKSKAAKSIMEKAMDAIGIHPNVAQKLSGADFDGDTVIVIPNNKGLIKTSSSLKGLENFDPISAYPGYPGMKPIKSYTKQTKMGEVSNLITDMTIKGANVNEIARAVRHSMVVIDSEKHNLNYKQSYIDNGIAALSEKYQNSKRGGASTLISKASSEIRVPHRKSGYSIDPITGSKVYTETGQTYVDSKGRTIKRTSSSTKMAETPNAFSLSSGRPIEEVYASYANDLKALANASRRAAVTTKPTPYSPSARVAYQKEVDTLNAQLKVALKNKPVERQAQILANSVVNRKKQANPNMDNDDLKKIRNQALAEARARTGAKKTQINITDREWEAIQAGAISSSKLTQILQNSDLNKVKQLATPRTSVSMSPAKVARAKTMLTSGYTQAEVAEALGVSTSTLSKSLN